MDSEGQVPAGDDQETDAGRRAAEDGDDSDAGGSWSTAGATQRKRRKLDVQDAHDGAGDDEGYACGSLKRMVLRNFLCHPRLELTFGPVVNFITGRNGTGKSAIVAGIVLGLGGRASAMNRGQALRSYIRTGCSNASIKVTIANRGLDAYKPDVYGHEITVERKILFSGTTIYRIRDTAGKLITDKREELCKILYHFNILVDNPGCILTQDMSRTFLQSLKPKALYELFMHSTQMTKMTDDLKLIQENNRASKRALDEKASILPNLRQQIEGLQKQLDNFKLLDQTKEKLKAAEDELVWAKVRDLEQVLANKEKQIKVDIAKIDSIVKKVEKLEKSAMQLAQSISSLQMKESKLKDEHAEVKKLVSDMENTVKDTRERFVSEKADLNAYRTEIKMLTEEADALGRHITNLMSMVADKETTAAKQAAYEKALEDVRIAEEKLAMSNEDVKTARECVKQLEASLQMQRDRTTHLNKMFSQLKMQQQTLEQAEKNRLLRFGKEMPQLLRKINVAADVGQFVKKPRGPLGCCIDVKDGRWALAIETCLGPLLTAFVCDNFQDSALLDELIKSVNMARNPQIIVMQFGNGQLYPNIAQALQRTDVLTILNAVVITDSVVTNVLVDTRCIERIALFADVAVMRRVMYENPPAGIKEAFACSAARCQIEPVFRFYPSAKKHPIYLVRAVKDEIAAIENEIRANRSELSPLLSVINEECSVLKAKETELYERQKTVIEMTDSLEELKRTCAKCKRELEELRGGSIEAEMLNREKNKCEGLIAAKQNLLDLKEQEFFSLKIQWTEMKTRFTQLKSRRDELFQELRLLSQKVLDKEGKLRKCKSDKNATEQTVKNLTAGLEPAKSQLRDMKHDFEAAISTARQKCAERVTSSQPLETIELNIRNLQMAIQGSEIRLGDYNQVLASYNVKKKKLEVIEQHIEDMKGLVQMTEQVIATRTRKFQDIRNQISYVLRRTFKENLAVRDFEGELSISHENKEISLLVKRREPTEAAGTLKSSEIMRNLKGLSGGERSFATVCFILALWSVIDTPFRCLDEFDVFMDIVSRRLSSQMLVDFALQYSERRQFFFLTPLELSYLPKNPLVSVYQLAQNDQQTDENME